ncbi:hypothetical protein G1C97_0467 [Bifidobacterium sp. DSM 109959]|uniref:Tyr recombinase domain-containing protein n=2 Tax=Bifidobacterium olomucense TaxID=2675324 RepID=A0A7Y0HWD1_9BIFI|nr:hypothetical protein [Bifidobacterium sp. DSM 109959]
MPQDTEPKHHDQQSADIIIPTVFRTSITRPGVTAPEPEPAEPGAAVTGTQKNGENPIGRAALMGLVSGVENPEEPGQRSTEMRMRSGKKPTAARTSGSDDAEPVTGTDATVQTTEPGRTTTRRGTGRRNNKRVPLIGQQAWANPPTRSYPYWRVWWIDAAGKKHSTTVSGTEDDAYNTASEKLGYRKPKGPVHGTPKNPLVKDVYEEYVRAGDHPKWGSGTTSQKRQAMTRVWLVIGDKKIRDVVPSDLARIDMAGIRPAAQKRLRSEVRRLFDYAHSVYGIEGTGDDYAKPVPVVTNYRREESTTNVTVKKEDVPSTRWVACLITLTASTMNVTPLDEEMDMRTQREAAAHAAHELLTGRGTGQVPEYTTWIDTVSGEKQTTSGWTNEPLDGPTGCNPLDDIWRMGIPEDKRIARITGPLIRTEEAYQRANEDVARQYRRLTAFLAMGAGVGTRVGEQIALRVGNVLTPDQAAFLFVDAHIQNWDEETDDALRFDGRQPPESRRGWYGAIHIEEQYTQAGSGYRLGRPKWNNEMDDKTRWVHMPYYLPSWQYEDDPRPLREQIAGMDGMQRFAPHARTQDDESFWSSTREEVGYAWAEGYTPLGWCMLQWLIDLWNTPTLNRAAGGSLSAKLALFTRLLMFPTRRPTNDPDSLKVGMSEDWRASGHGKLIPGTGGYTNQKRMQLLTNPVMDYVSQRMELATKYNPWPPNHNTYTGMTVPVVGGKEWKAPRVGWTHHSLRHYSASIRLASGVPITLISKELGHKDISTTIETYIHLIDEAQSTIPSAGFEF